MEHNLGIAFGQEVIGVDVNYSQNCRITYSIHNDSWPFTSRQNGLAANLASKQAWDEASEVFLSTSTFYFWDLSELCDFILSERLLIGKTRRIQLSITLDDMKRDDMVGGTFKINREPTETSGRRRPLCPFPVRG